MDFLIPMNQAVPKVLINEIPSINYQPGTFSIISILFKKSNNA